MNQTAKQIEEVMRQYERRRDYDALEDLKPLVLFGGFKIDNAQDYRAYQLGKVPRGWLEAGKKNSRQHPELRNGEGYSGGTGSDGTVNNSRTHRSLPVAEHAAIASKEGRNGEFPLWPFLCTLYAVWKGLRFPGRDSIKEDVGGRETARIAWAAELRIESDGSTRDADSV